MSNKTIEAAIEQSIPRMKGSPYMWSRDNLIDQLPNLNRKWLIRVIDGRDLRIDPEGKSDEELRRLITRNIMEPGHKYQDEAIEAAIDKLVEAYPEPVQLKGPLVAKIAKYALSIDDLDVGYKDTFSVPDIKTALELTFQAGVEAGQGAMA